MKKSSMWRSQNSAVEFSFQVTAILKFDNFTVLLLMIYFLQIFNKCLQSDGRIRRFEVYGSQLDNKPFILKLIFYNIFIYFII